jgi:hypothetical protein
VIAHLWVIKTEKSCRMATDRVGKENPTWRGNVFQLDALMSSPQISGTGPTANSVTHVEQPLSSCGLLIRDDG